MYKNREDKSRDRIKIIIDTWNFIKFGKITQFKMAYNNSINIKTVEKYYKEFKIDIQEKNRIFKNAFK